MCCSFTCHPRSLCLFDRLIVRIIMGEGIIKNFCHWIQNLLEIVMLINKVKCSIDYLLHDARGFY